MTKIYGVKDWFENKLAEEMSLPRLYNLELFCGIKETEKAVYGMFYIGYDRAGVNPKRKCAWLPKSCIENIEEMPMFEYDEAVKEFYAEYPTM